MESKFEKIKNKIIQTQNAAYDFDGRVAKLLSIFTHELKANDKKWRGRIEEFQKKLKQGKLINFGWLDEPEIKRERKEIEFDGFLKAIKLFEKALDNLLKEKL